MSIATDAAARWVAAAILACALAGGVRAESTTGQAQGERSLLSAEFLSGNAGMPSPVDTAAYTALNGSPPTQRFEGRLQFLADAEAGHVRGLVDWFGYLENPALNIASLPEFSFDLVQSGDALIPVERGPQRSAHPHWEFILEPGRVWNEDGDGGWSRASLPFALQERNANCTHNGLLSFLFQSDGRVSRVAYQVGSETCQYLQADLWGMLKAVYTPRPIKGAETVVENFRKNLALRMPVKPLSDLAAAFPGLGTQDFDWFPPGEVSAVGIAIDGIHYRGGCRSRYGDYPFCEVLDLPSYSLAKSLFAGTAFMALRQEYPEAGKLKVTDFVPECRNGDRWNGVTLAHLVDMGTGNYASLEHEVDEYASYETAFMEGDTHSAKINTACTLFPRKAAPGSTFAYHTSDTYIAGTLMNAWLQRQAESAPRDVHADILVAKAFDPLGLSPVMRTTKRTYDSVAQPFAGYGLTLHTDDIVRLGMFLGRDGGVIDGQQVLHPGELSAALQRDPTDPGLVAGDATLRYNNGFWAYHTDLGGACEEALWIPFMSGYGGISVVLMPNQSVFYVFSDHGRFEWLKAAIASNRIRPFCSAPK